MREIHVVIGANYGDEGKGRTTAWLAKQSRGRNVAVVRFNGGAQAGHTVVEGSVRHVFSHIGSGGLSGVPTILTSDFVTSPFLFKKEVEALGELGVTVPVVMVSPECLVTTPWDGWINQILENSRGDRRHGSVGVGFGETLERSQTYPEYRLTVSDLLNPASRREKLTRLVDRYLPDRISDLGINVDRLSEDDRWMYRDRHHVLTVFESQCDYFLDHIRVVSETGMVSGFDTLIFEGAQGLALDQNSPDFPHVTRSNTGIDNVLSFLERVGETGKIYPTYVTRCYLTRHGAGPLPGEISGEDFGEHFQVVDNTNRPHKYQGSLRFAPLDPAAMSIRVSSDLRKIPPGRVGYSSIVVTCMDQPVKSGLLTIKAEGEINEIGTYELVGWLFDQTGVDRVLTCVGERAEPLVHTHSESRFD